MTPLQRKLWALVTAILANPDLRPEDALSFLVRGCIRLVWNKTIDNSILPDHVFQDYMMLWEAYNDRKWQ